MIAAREGYTECVRLLVDGGANLDTKENVCVDDFSLTCLCLCLCIYLVLLVVLHASCWRVSFVFGNALAGQVRRFDHMH
jgi:hypothetical protein